MTKISNNFESLEEIKQLNLKRLFNNQKLQLKELSYYLYEKYDKNKVYNCLENILLINSVINKRLNGK